MQAKMAPKQDNSRDKRRAQQNSTEKWNSKLNKNKNKRELSMYNVDTISSNIRFIYGQLDMFHIIR
jgi:hypothetical protein